MHADPAGPTAPGSNPSPGMPPSSSIISPPSQGGPGAPISNPGGNPAGTPVNPPSSPSNPPGSSVTPPTPASVNPPAPTTANPPTPAVVNPPTPPATTPTPPTTPTALDTPPAQAPIEAPSAETPTEEVPTDGIRRVKVPDYILAYSVANGDKPLNQEQLNQLVDLTQKFWTKKFNEFYANRPGVQFQGIEMVVKDTGFGDDVRVPDKPGEPKLNYFVNFDTNLLYNSGAPEEPLTNKQTFDQMARTQSEFADYILNYARKVPGLEQTIRVVFRAWEKLVPAKARNKGSVASEVNDLPITAIAAGLSAAMVFAMLGLWGLQRNGKKGHEIDEECDYEPHHKIIDDFGAATVAEETVGETLGDESHLLTSLRHGDALER